MNPLLITPRFPSSHSSMHSRRAARSSIPASSTSSTIRLGNALSDWSKLSAKLHDFTQVCFLEETTPDLLISFKHVDRTFSIFTHRARLHISNIRPSSAIGRTSATVEKFVSAIVTDWRNFVSHFSAVIGHNLSPLYTYLVNQMPDLLTLVRGLSHFYDRPHAILATAGMPKAKALIATLKAEAVKLNRQLAHSDLREFDVIEYQHGLVTLAEKVRTLFPDVFPNNAMTLGTVVECKRDLLVAFEKAIGACEGMQKFGYLAKDVMVVIFEMTQALEETCRVIGIPKTICFQVEDDQTIELAEIEERQTVLEVMKTCERIQKRLLRITGGRAVEMSSMGLGGVNAFSADADQTATP